MNCILLLLIFISFIFKSSTCLYPFESASRNKISLNGLWEFKVDFKNEGFYLDWPQKVFKYELDDIREIAVPSSYNEIYTNETIRNHLGWVWYNRQFYINNALKSQIGSYSVSLRIASCHYYCVVWLNGVQLGTHESGHLPFEFDISNMIASSQSEFNLVIAVNNTLTSTTLPPGQIFYGTNSSLYPPGYIKQILQMDFFNYAGIHRDVVLYIKPLYSIQDIFIYTDYSDNVGSVEFGIFDDCPGIPTFNVSLKDQKNNIIANINSPGGNFVIQNATAWWPRGMNPNYGYLYTLESTMTCSHLNKTFTDTYSLKVGIRKINWSQPGDAKTSLTINNEPFYCKGVNKHEDFLILGRGIDFSILLKDVYLFEWLNINCIRTSHYPYTEEFLQLTDSLGIAVIDEVPAVGLTQANNFNSRTLYLHRGLLTELYNRDKNHPSVIMWSLANEPASNLNESYSYFKQLFSFMLTLDKTRPRTFTISASLDKDLCANFSDIISINRYYGWYIESGSLDLIKYQLSFDIQSWHDKYKKPLLITEYGAEAIPGLHCYPESLFCEEYQTSLLTEHHKIFDSFKNNSILFGELIWNFADFMTDQSLQRVYGNHKGVFTRDRQPKPSAFLLKTRYESMNKA